MPNYWEQSAAEHKAEWLSKAFMKEYFDAIHEWYGNHPQIQPLHVWDLFAPNDNNFRREQYHAGSDEDDHLKNEPHIEDPMDASESDPVACTFLVSPV